MKPGLDPLPGPSGGTTACRGGSGCPRRHALSPDLPARIGLSWEGLAKRLAKRLVTRDDGRVEGRKNISERSREIIRDAKRVRERAAESLRQARALRKKQGEEADA